MPIAMPMGVMSAKIAAMMHFCRVEAAALGSSAMHVPRATPSNIWWKRMTMKRVMKKLSPDTTRVMPMTGGEVSWTIRCGGISGRKLTDGVEDDARF